MPFLTFVWSLMPKSSASRSTKGDTPAHDQQKPYYWGKKKAHTLKNQVGVRPDGHIDALSESVPGGANHDRTLLRQTKLLDRLTPEEAAMTGKGYDGLQKDHPGARIYQPFQGTSRPPLD